METDKNASATAEPAFVVDLRAGGALQGWVVVDTLVDGLAMGGTRMTHDVTEEEVRGLARSMTEKMTLVGLRVGGAKAGIVANGADREKTFRTFGRTVQPLLHGGIHLGIDLGVTPADRAVFFAEADYAPERRPHAIPMPIDWRTYYEPLVDCTGFGVSVAAAAALEGARIPAPARVVVQGFGAVGRAVARFLQERGHRIVAVADAQGTVSAESLPIDDLIGITDSYGTIDRSRLPDHVTIHDGADTWLDVDADLLVLAANMHALNRGNVDRLRARVVVEGGNLCSTDGAKAKVRSAGGVLVPDVIGNVGGAAAAALALTRTVPFELSDSARKAWVFDWVGARVDRNARDLLEIASSSSHDPLPDLLNRRMSR